jgi:7-cyano-7-deazaguanine synthase in queuosine biosynthesis
MKIICAPANYKFPKAGEDNLNVALFSRTVTSGMGSIGAAVIEEIIRKKLQPSPRAWDLLSIALSIIAADLGCKRSKSPDGWTRCFDLHIAVNDPGFWLSQKKLLEEQIRFLTTDLWNINFLEGGIIPVHDKNLIMPEENGVVLLSGGLDSLIGTLDLITNGNRPYAVSQIVKGDKEKQSYFASTIGGGLHHIQLNHNADIPEQEQPPSQRARSIIFLAYGVLISTALKQYHNGQNVTLHVCENGFISINPPLTDIRIGSLSTRTAHPIFLTLFQRLLDAAGLRIIINNPYRYQTKGEMLKMCSSQEYLMLHAHSSTSCGRFGRMGYKHCGRCVPCLIRRAAFHAWGVQDKTEYRYNNLGLDDKDHARFDDVRAAAMAVAKVKESGLDSWLGTSLLSKFLSDITPYEEVISRGLNELGQLLIAFGIK